MKNIIDWLFGFVLSYLWICVLIKLITICFGLLFTWPIATGIWFILLFLRSVKILFLNK